MGKIIVVKTMLFFGLASMVLAGMAQNERPQPNPAYRIHKVVCTLRRAVEPRAEYRFGPDARLIVEGCTAVWTFGKD
jgi:hypothetical protein